MRHLTLAAVCLSAASFAAPAFAVREPGPLKVSSGSALAVFFLIVVTALIVGVAMMNPRRTHHDRCFRPRPPSLLQRNP